MIQFYEVLYSSDRAYKPFGVAHTPRELDFFTHPVNGQKIEHWQKIFFDLKEGKFADYLANDYGVRVCSENIKQIIEETRNAEDDIECWML